MNFADLVEFFVMQIGWESLEDVYEHYVHHEPYGLAAFNAEVERLRLLSIKGGKESHNAILKHLGCVQNSEAHYREITLSLEARGLSRPPDSLISEKVTPKERHSTLPDALLKAMEACLQSKTNVKLRASRRSCNARAPQRPH